MRSIRNRKALRSGGFTLVELLVVISIIAILASLITPMVARGTGEAYKTKCLNNLKQIGMAAQSYSGDYRGRFPWHGNTGDSLENIDDTLRCIEKIYTYDYLDTTQVFICAASPDNQAEEIDELKERRETFVLGEENCSYTWRNTITTVNSNSGTPISGDRRGGEGDLTNHKDGRHVLFKSNSVEFFNLEQLDAADNKQAQRFRKELVGFGASS